MSTIRETTGCSGITLLRGVSQDWSPNTRRRKLYPILSCFRLLNKSHSTARFSVRFQIPFNLIFYLFSLRTLFKSKLTLAVTIP